MANVVVNLPTNAADGPGTAVDVSALGALKTIVASGNGFVFEPTVTIEASLDAAGDEWSPIFTFLLPGEATVSVVAHRLRARVSNYRGGGAPQVDVGGEDDASAFVQLVATAGDGDGAGADVSDLGPIKTVQVGGGGYGGTVNIEISEDGGSSFRTAMSFPAGARGVQTERFVADFMRVNRTGVPLVQPGLPIVWVGGTDDADPAGGLMALPEQWGQQPVTANQNQVALSALVSMNFDDIIIPNDGSVCRLVARLTSPLDAAECELSVLVTINGVPTALEAAIVFPNSSAIAIAAPNDIPYLRGDRIGCVITTNAAFSAGIDPAIECWIEVVEKN